MRQIFGFVLSLLLISSSAQAITCEGRFLDSGTKRLDDFTVRTATACFGSGNCVVLINKPSNRRQFSAAQIREVLGANGLMMNYSVSNSPSVNCHAFSCQVVGIPHFPTNAWLDARDFAILLQEFFNRSHQRYSLSEFGRLASDPAASEGDIVLMTGWNNILQHSGVVKRVQVGNQIQNWVLSKLDEGPTVLVPLTSLGRFYPLERALIVRRK